MRKLFSTKRRIVAAVLTVGIMAGGAGAAYAYFGATGTGTGTVFVGANADFTVSVSGPNSGEYLYPDNGPGSGPNIEHFSYSVLNNSGGNVLLSHVTISITGLTGGCNATWFSVDGQTPTGTNTQAPATTLAGGATYHGNTTLELIDNGSDQSVCESQTPTLSVQATST